MKNYILPEPTQKKLLSIQNQLHMNIHHATHLMQNHIIQHELFHIPYPNKNIEKLDGSQDIQVETVKIKYSPHRLLKKIYSSWYIKENARRQAARYPGVLIINPDIEEALQKKIDYINQLKNEFKITTLTIPELYRWHHLHKLFPGLQTLELYRKINTYPSNIPIAAVRFYWAIKEVVSKVSVDNNAKKSQENKKKLITQLCNKIQRKEKELKKWKKNHHNAVHTQIEKEIQQIKKELNIMINTQDFSTWRVIKPPLPRPEYSIRIENNLIAPQIGVANIPLIIYSYQPITIRSLKTFCARNKKISRQKYHRIPVCPSLHLYKLEKQT